MKTGAEEQSWNEEKSTITVDQPNTYWWLWDWLCCSWSETAWNRPYICKRRRRSHGRSRRWVSPAARCIWRRHVCLGWYPASVFLVPGCFVLSCRNCKHLGGVYRRRGRQSVLRTMLSAVAIQTVPVCRAGIINCKFQLVRGPNCSKCFVRVAGGVVDEHTTLARFRKWFSIWKLFSNISDRLDNRLFHHWRQGNRYKLIFVTCSCLSMIRCSSNL